MGEPAKGWFRLTAPGVAAACAALVLAACSGSHEGRMRDAGSPPPPPADAERPMDSGPRYDAGLCRTNAECSDGVFCNGTEFCDPRNERTDARGCVAGDPPCIDGLVCTVESDPPCNDETRGCNPVTVDHSLCPEGLWCRRVWGCTEAVPCPEDGSPCEDTDPDPCKAQRCEDGDPPLCVSMPVPDGIPCTTAAGDTGECRRGSCGPPGTDAGPIDAGTADTG